MVFVHTTGQEATDKLKSTMTKAACMDFQFIGIQMVRCRAMDFIQEDSGMAYWKPSTQVAVENLERCGIEGAL